VLSNGFFTGAATLADSLLMASLVQDVNSDPQPGTTVATWQCMMRQKWASLGADFASIQFFSGVNPEVNSGNGAILRAGNNVYAVFGSISPAVFPILTATMAYPPVQAAQVSGGTKLNSASIRLVSCIWKSWQASRCSTSCVQCAVLMQLQCTVLPLLPLLLLLLLLLLQPGSDVVHRPIIVLDWNPCCAVADTAAAAAVAAAAAAVAAAYLLTLQQCSSAAASLYMLLLALLLLQVNSVFFNYYNTYVAQGLLNAINTLATADGGNRRVFFGGHSGGSMVAVFGALALTSARVGNVYLFGHEKVRGQLSRHQHFQQHYVCATGFIATFESSCWFWAVFHYTTKH
jgi:hypothetical protein